MFQTWANIANFPGPGPAVASSQFSIFLASSALQRYNMRLSASDTCIIFQLACPRVDKQNDQFTPASFMHFSETLSFITYQCGRLSWTFRHPNFSPSTIIYFGRPCPYACWVIYPGTKVTVSEFRILYLHLLSILARRSTYALRSFLILVTGFPWSELIGISRPSLPISVKPLLVVQIRPPSISFRMLYR